MVCVWDACPVNPWYTVVCVRVMQSDKQRAPPTQNGRTPPPPQKTNSYALKTGGPACLVWGWLLTWGMTVACAFAMGEICST